jgi:hypothetical protein
MMTPTPASTRRYRTRAVIDAEQYFDISRLLDSLDPPITDREMEYVHRAAVASFAYDGHRGRQSPFPSPADFIDALWGLDERSPSMSGTQGERNTTLLRLAYKIKETIKEELRDADARLYILDCPLCGQHNTHVNIGPPPYWNVDILWKPRMLTIRFFCECRRFKFVHYDIVEKLALEKAASDFALL